MGQEERHSGLEEPTRAGTQTDSAALQARVEELECANMEMTDLLQESEAAGRRYAQQLTAINAQLEADILGREKVEGELRETQERYRRITREVTDYVYTVRVENGRAVETRHGIGCEAITGYSPEELQQDPGLWFRMILEDDRPAVQANVEKILAGEDVPPFEHRIIRKDGDLCWIRSTPVPCHDPEGRLRYYDGVIKDITFRRKAEKLLEESEAKYRELVENALSLILRLDSEGRIVFFNEFAQRYFGYAAGELIGKPFFGGIVQDAEDEQKASAILLNTPERYRLFENRVLCADGCELWVSWRIKPLLGGNGALTGLLAVGIDVTERRKLEEQLRQLSRRDGLTGIYNRRVFDETLDTEFQRAFRSRQSLSLILLDIDHFKRFNDSCGHQAGDDCLKRVATALEDACKRPTDLAARYGGEEFAIILPDTDPEGAMRLAESLRRKVAAINIPHPDSPVAPHITVSLGVATTVLGETKDAQTLLAQADHALYTAKGLGRDQVRNIAGDTDG